MGTKVYGALQTGIHAIQWHICRSWVVPGGRNDTSIISRILWKFAFYKSKNISLDWMVDFSCARTSIRGQEIPGRESCSLAMKTGAMFQCPTLCDSDLECAQSSMICQQTLQLCSKYVSQWLIFWQKYSISPRLTLLPQWLANMEWWIGHMDMDSSLSGASELPSNASKSCRIATIKRAVSYILPEVLNITKGVSLPNGIGKCAMLELSYCNSSHMQRILRHTWILIRF